MMDLLSQTPSYYPLLDLEKVSAPLRDSLGFDSVRRSHLIELVKVASPAHKVRGYESGHIFATSRPHRENVTLYRIAISAPPGAISAPPGAVTAPRGMRRIPQVR